MASSTRHTWTWFLSASCRRLFPADDEAVNEILDYNKFVKMTLKRALGLLPQPYGKSLYGWTHDSLFRHPNQFGREEAAFDSRFHCATGIHRASLRA
jgi:hypothetical protein